MVTTATECTKDLNMDVMNMNWTRRTPVMNKTKAWYLSLLPLLALICAGWSYAEVTFTVVSADGSTKSIAVEESPDIEIGYTDTGMRLEFKNMQVVLQCVGGDISTESGLCLLKAYEPSNYTPVQSAPGAPGNPTASSAGVGAVALSWSAPASNGGSPITGYRIRAQLEGQSSWNTVVSDTGSAATSATVSSGLTQGESYRFRVAAWNANGLGNESGGSGYVTVESSGPGGLTLASACINSPAIVKCDKTVIPENFYSQFGQEVTQPASKVLSMPFIAAESTSGRGFFTLKSFMSAVDAASTYSFEFWISETPNGPLLQATDGGAGTYCRTGQSTTRVNWRQGSDAYLVCDIGTENRILYVNSKMYRIESNGQETLYPYDSPTSRKVTYTIQGSIQELP